MSSELSGWTRSRPIRIAFLVEDGEHSDLVLDGIFADCYGRWGGRFSLIARCEDRKIVPAYWPWLEEYAPDLVYSYVDLSNEDILEIHERLAPADYKFHHVRGEPRLDVFGFKPSYGFSPLSSLASVFRLARYAPPGRKGGPLKIIDHWFGEQASRMLTDNFGTYHHTAGTSLFPHDAQVAASLITIVSPERQKNKQQLGLSPDAIAIPNETAAYEEFANRNAWCLAVLSAQLAPRLEFHDHRWHNSLNVVVGETFADRLLFWNARLLAPAWLDGDIGAIRVTSEALQDPDFLKALGLILKYRNHYGGGGHHNVTIRSTSTIAENIEAARAAIAGTQPWGHVATELLESADAIIPSNQVLKRSSERNSGTGLIMGQPGWTEFGWTPPTVRPPVKIPDHLADVPPQHSFADGYWCADFTLECDGAPEPRFGNKTVWALPKRWRMSRAFTGTLVGNAGPTGWALPGWRGRTGTYSMCVSLARPVNAIDVPKSADAIRWALEVDGARPIAEVYPASKVARMEPSNEARYLDGILGMTGGLAGARGFLLHPFLVDVFASLGGATNLPIEKVVPTANRLRRQARFEGTFDLKDERERFVLADLLLKAARSLKKPLDWIGYDRLTEAWKQHCEDYWARHPREIDPDDQEYWEDQQRAMLDGCLIAMRQRQIMFQGHEWTCPACHHRNWLDMSELALQIACKICKRTEPTPIDIKWRFRPNEFVIQALRDHSVLSLLWTLTALQARSRASFMFTGPSWFYPNAESGTSPDAEADLLVLIDGEAIVCEVKASWSVLRRKDVADLVKLAKRLRPDTAMLAVMEDRADMAQELEAARTELAGVGIDFEVLTLREFGLEDDPWLLS
jgi:hypothetical protein